MNYNGDTITINDGEIVQEVDTRDVVESHETDPYTAAWNVVEQAIEGDGEYYEIEVNPNE